MEEPLGGDAKRGSNGWAGFDSVLIADSELLEQRSSAGPLPTFYNSLHLYGQRIFYSP
jgi:hypothetical protein